MAKTSKKSSKSTKTSKSAKTAKKAVKAVSKPAMKPVAAKPVVANSIAAKPIAKAKNLAKKPAAKKMASKKPAATKPAVDLKAMAADVKGWLVEYFPSPNQKLSDAALQKSINAKLKSFPKIAASNKLLSVNEVTARFVAKLTEDEKSMLRKRFAA